MTAAQVVWTALSSRQGSIWLDLQTMGATPSYLVGGSARLHAEIDVDLFRSSLLAVARAHDALRLEIDPVEPRQRVRPLDESLVRLDLLDLAATPDPEAEFQALARETFTRPFRLGADPLWKVILARLGGSEWGAILCCHHLIVDGLSVPVLIRAIVDSYESLAHGETPRPRSSSFLESVTEDLDYGQSRRAKADLAYWATRFETLPEPVFEPRADGSADAAGAVDTLVEVELGRNLVDAFARCCTARNLRPLPAFLSLAGLLLHQASGRRDLAIGVAVPGRGRGALHKVGMFNGALPVRLAVDPDSSLERQAAEAGLRLAEDYMHQRTSIDAICRAAGVTRQGRRGVFDVLLSYIPADLADFDIRFGGSAIVPTILRGPEAHPLAIYLCENTRGEPLLAQFSWNPDYLDRDTVEALARRFAALVRAFVEDPDRSAGSQPELAAGFSPIVAAPEPRRGTLRILSTFTSQPLERPLAYWLKRLGVSWAVDFAHYSQLFQDLLDPSSETRRNAHGANVVLLRIEDWVRYRSTKREGGEARRLVLDTAGELAGAMAEAGLAMRVPLLLVICPPSPDWDRGGPFHSVQAEAEAILAERLGTAGMALLTYAETRALYPVEHEWEPQGDRLGHVPYTPEAFTALATGIVRRLHALVRHPVKVVVADCDNTLWSGVVGEDGPQGLVLREEHLALQRRLVAAAEAGLLVCLCSKNSDADVMEVFRTRQDMVLRPDHIVARRINWAAKSANLRELSTELGLGLDSFVFLDDNPVEVAEVLAALPQVNAVTVPVGGHAPRRWVEGLWPIDAVARSAADRSRTQLYRDNAERTRLQKEASSLADFIANLGLRIEIREPASEDLPRLAQLTERTNQFNLNGLRRSGGDFAEALAGRQEHVRAVWVSDRFGEYGLVGALACRTDGDAVAVTTFLMSCRVLGRGVEHAMLAEMGRYALDQGLSSLHLRLVHRPRNEPIAAFLNALEADRTDAAGETLVVVAAAAAAACAFRPERTAEPAMPSGTEAREAASGAAVPPLAGEDWSRIAALSVAEIDEDVHRTAAVRRRVAVLAREPSSPLEAELCNHAARLLGVAFVSPDEDLFDLGLSSLQAVQLVAHLRSAHAVTLPVRDLFEARTVARIAADLASGRARAAPYRALVKLQEGPGPKLFCVHAANGDAVSFMRLAAALGPHYTVYGLEARGLAPGEQPMASVAEMAEAYLGEVLALDLDEPLNLLGWSFGGLVAHEMAVRLERRGLRVGHLIFMDSPVPAAVGPQRLSENDVLKILASDLESVEKNFDLPLNAWMSQDRSVSIEEVIEMAQRMGVAPPTYTVDEARRKIAVNANNTLLAARHMPGWYGGALLQFRALKRGSGYVYDWERFADSVTTVDIDCNHVRIGFEPFVGTVARGIHQVLEPVTSTRVEVEIGPRRAARAGRA